MSKLLNLRFSNLTLEVPSNFKTYLSVFVPALNVKITALLSGAFPLNVIVLPFSVPAIIGIVICSLYPSTLGLISKTTCPQIPELINAFTASLIVG